MLAYPIPGQQLVQPMDGDAGEDIGQPGLRVDVIHFAGLCRPPNYAERI